MNTNLESYFLVVTLAISALGFILFIASSFFKLKLHNLIQQTFFSTCFFSLFAILLIRGINLQRFPCSNLYESLLIVALAASAITVFFSSKYKMHFLAWPSSLFITSLLAYSISLPESQRDAIPLIPALNSYWRVIHVPALLTSYGFLTIAGIISGFYLFESYQTESLDSKKKKLDFYEECIYRCVSFGFPLLTFGIVTGALWANNTWGNLWQWDPKENLALVTWFIYLAYLHLKLSNKASTKTLAWVNLIGIIAIYITYIGINQFDLGGLHTYGRV